MLYCKNQYSEDLLKRLWRILDLKLPTVIRGLAFPSLSLVANPNKVLADLSAWTDVHDFVPMHMITPGFLRLHGGFEAAVKGRRGLRYQLAHTQFASKKEFNPAKAFQIEKVELVDEDYFRKFTPGPGLPLGILCDQRRCPWNRKAR